jgi:DNA (cytosine-5)-methyltransferase 1
MRARAPLRRAAPVIPDLFEEDISVDLFAGGGGASIGTESALNKPVTIAINHDPVAIAVHADNHPSTEHYTADIFEVDPVKACRGRRVRHLHASPDCRHFSRAKGSKPVSDSVRSLADVVPNWLEAVRPDVVTMENVPEFPEWGPLDRNGRPIKARRGEFFRPWLAKIVALGYVVEFRNLIAYQFGAPTSRKRFFLVARCDGQPICWPAPTHGSPKERAKNPKLKPWRTAAECIDWSIPGKSIFDRARPLADATLRRVAAGFVRYVIESANPFVVTLRNNVAPRGGDQPLTTVAAQGNHHALLQPHIVKVNHGEKGKKARGARSLQEPLTTVTATQRGHALVSPVIIGCGGRAGQSAPTGGEQPVGTITAKNDRCLVAPTMVQTGHGERKGQRPRALDLHQPLGTVVATAQNHALVDQLLAPFISQFNLGQVGKALKEPLPTVTAIDHHALVRTELVPAEFAEAYPNARKVLPFLIAFYGEGSGKVGHALDIPLPTITTKDRFAIVVVEIDGKTYAVVDITLRMLEPHELLRAQFGDFADGYSLAKALTKKDKVRLVGNSVVPHMQRAVVLANLAPFPTPRATPRRRAA